MNHQRTANGEVMHIVLVEPEIPGNTGNIARLCAAAGCLLDLVEPLGFSLEDRYLKRAGLDYWHLINVRRHASLAALWQVYPGRSFYLFTTKAEKRHTDVVYSPDDLLLFGKETAGLPAELLAAHRTRCVRIPMKQGSRSLNLSNAASVAVYEALRQTGYKDCS